MILVVDQSTNKSGYAVIDENESIITYGLIDLSKMPKHNDFDQTKKRNILISQINKLVNEYKIYQIITEGVYMHKNVDTHKKLSKMQGSLEDYCLQNDIVCFSFANAGEWRKAIGVKAQKRDEYKLETKKYVLSNYTIENNLEDDIYDAIGMASAYFIMVKE